jgi:TatD DNase family protein
MKIIDTHAHLDFPDFDPDREQLVEELSAASIGVINPATDRQSIERVDRLSRQHPLIWGALGLHPTDVTASVLTELPSLIEQWQRSFEKNPKLVAVGEVGLDYYHRADSAPSQKAALRQFLTLAKERRLPVIFHCRDAYGDLVTMLADYPGTRGVIHCFSGTQEQAERFIALGLYISFTNIITYAKNEGLRQTAAALPLEKILVETDAPFLPPEDKRGERNDPRNVAGVAETIARLHNSDLDAIAKQTTINARELFSLE